MANQQIAYFAAMIVIALTITIGANQANGALSCGQVASFVSPCITYLRNSGSSPSESCCSGVRGLNRDASTTDERRNVCSCLVSTAGRINGLNQARVSGLPSACGVSLSFTISASTNCKTIK